MLFDFDAARYNNVLVKLTSKCNLSCSYCYVKPHKTKAPVMSKGVLSSIFDKYSSYAQALEPERRFMYFIWHGGEPLLCGNEYFEKLIRSQQSFQDRNCTFYNGIQTNGTLLNKKWLDFFAKNSFSVGLSLDGPRFVQGLSRGEDTFKDIEKNISLLNEYGLPFSIISVVTNEMVPYWKEVYNFFMSLEVRYIDFLPCYNVNNSNTLSVENYEKFYLAILDKWLSDEVRNEIRFFSDLLKRITKTGHGEGLGCEVMGQCGEIQYITENGDLYPCTVLPVTDDLRIGNIVQDDLSKCVTSSNYIHFQGQYNSPNDCEKCGYIDVCRGGCAARRLYPATPNNTGKDIYCQPRQKIIKTLQNYVKKVESHEQRTAKPELPN